MLFLVQTQTDIICTLGRGVSSRLVDGNVHTALYVEFLLGKYCIPSDMIHTLTSSIMGRLPCSTNLWKIFTEKSKKTLIVAYIFICTC
jgi:hypothetical protein